MQIIAMLVTNMQVHIDRLHLKEKKNEQMDTCMKESVNKGEKWWL